MQPGEKSPQEIIAEIEEGFFVTHLLGSGANIVTGDVSRGARGFRIEKGRITHPVSEMTIAGNLKDMWMSLTPANDLELKFGVDAPTLRVDGMMVAGS
jgi:PmbA protein